MKAYLSLASIVLLLLALSCNDSTTSGDNVSDTTAQHIIVADTFPQIIQKAKTGEKESVLSHAQDSITVESVIDSAFVPRYITVEIKDAGTLTGEVITKDASANIRINRIIMDKATDGPFGQQISYGITSPGKYTLEITSSRMADNPYSGAFSLVLKLKDSSDKKR